MLLLLNNYNYIDSNNYIKYVICYLRNLFISIALKQHNNKYTNKPDKTILKLFAAQHRTIMKNEINGGIENGRS